MFRKLPNIVCLHFLDCCTMTFIRTFSKADITYNCIYTRNNVPIDFHTFMKNTPFCKTMEKLLKKVT